MSTATARILRAPAAPAPGPASPATFYRDPAAGEAKRPALLVAGTAAARPRPQPAVHCRETDRFWPACALPWRSSSTSRPWPVCGLRSGPSCELRLAAIRQAQLARSTGPEGAGAPCSLGSSR